MTPDDADLQDPLLIACRGLWEAMDQFEEAAARHLGVGRSDLRALNLLEDGPLTPAVVADKLGLRRASVTALVDRLEAAGRVTRAAIPGNRRSTLIELTPETWQTFAAVYRPIAQRVHAASARLDDTKLRAAINALSTITDVFTDTRSELERS